MHLVKARASKAKENTERAKAKENNESKDSTGRRTRARTRARTRLSVGTAEDVGTARKNVVLRRTPQVVRREDTNPIVQMLTILTRNYHLLNQKLKLTNST